VERSACLVGDVTRSGMEGEKEAAGGGHTTRGYRNVWVHLPLPRQGKRTSGEWDCGRVGDGRSWPSDRRGAVRPLRRGDRRRP
jgi:hypothetical protein